MHLTDVSTRWQPLSRRRGCYRLLWMLLSLCVCAQPLVAQTSSADPSPQQCTPDTLWDKPRIEKFFAAVENAQRLYLAGIQTLEQRDESLASAYAEMMRAVPAAQSEARTVQLIEWMQAIAESQLAEFSLRMLYKVQSQQDLTANEKRLLQELLAGGQNGADAREYLSGMLPHLEVLKSNGVMLTDKGWQFVWNAKVWPKDRRADVQLDLALALFFPPALLFALSEPERRAPIEFGGYYFLPEPTHLEHSNWRVVTKEQWQQRMQDNLERFNELLRQQLKQAEGYGRPTLYFSKELLDATNDYSNALTRNLIQTYSQAADWGAPPQMLEAMSQAMLQVGRVTGEQIDSAVSDLETMEMAVYAAPLIPVLIYVAPITAVPAAFCLGTGAALTVGKSLVDAHYTDTSFLQALGDNNLRIGSRTLLYAPAFMAIPVAIQGVGAGVGYAGGSAALQTNVVRVLSVGSAVGFGGYMLTQSAVQFEGAAENFRQAEDLTDKPSSDALKRQGWHRLLDGTAQGFLAFALGRGLYTQLRTPPQSTPPVVPRDSGEFTATDFQAAWGSGPMPSWPAAPRLATSATSPTAPSYESGGSGGLALLSPPQARVATGMSTTPTAHASAQTSAPAALVQAMPSSAAQPLMALAATSPALQPLPETPHVEPLTQAPLALPALLLADLTDQATHDSLSEGAQEAYRRFQEDLLRRRRMDYENLKASVEGFGELFENFETWLAQGCPFPDFDGRLPQSAHHERRQSELDDSIPVVSGLEEILLLTRTRFKYGHTTRQERRGGVRASVTAAAVSGTMRSFDAAGNSLEFIQRADGGTNFDYVSRQGVRTHLWVQAGTQQPMYRLPESALATLPPLPASAAPMSDASGYIMGPEVFPQRGDTTEIEWIFVWDPVSGRFAHQLNGVYTPGHHRPRTMFGLSPTYLLNEVAPERESWGGYARVVRGRPVVELSFDSLGNLGNFPQQLLPRFLQAMTNTYRVRPQDVRVTRWGVLEPGSSATTTSETLRAQIRAISDDFITAHGSMPEGIREAIESEVEALLTHQHPQVVVDLATVQRLHRYKLARYFVKRYLIGKLMEDPGLAMQPNTLAILIGKDSLLDLSLLHVRPQLSFVDGALVGALTWLDNWYTRVYSPLTAGGASLDIDALLLYCRLAQAYFSQRNLPPITTLPILNRFGWIDIDASHELLGWLQQQPSLNPWLLDEITALLSLYGQVNGLLSPQQLRAFLLDQPLRLEAVRWKQKASKKKNSEARAILRAFPLADGLKIGDWLLEHHAEHGLRITAHASGMKVDEVLLHLVDVQVYELPGELRRIGFWVFGGGYREEVVRAVGLGEATPEISQRHNVRPQVIDDFIEQLYW